MRTVTPLVTSSFVLVMMLGRTILLVTVTAVLAVTVFVVTLGRGWRGGGSGRGGGSTRANGA